MGISVEKVRNAINNNSLVVSIATVVVIVSLIFFLLYNMRVIGNSVRVPTKSFYVEEEDMSVTERPIADIPPLMGKSGKLTLVRGVFYTYTTDKDKKLAYMEKYTEKAKAAMEKMQKSKEMNGEEVMIAEEGLWVRSKDDPKWYKSQTEQGQKILSAVGAEGTGTPPKNDPKDLRIVMPN